MSIDSLRTSLADRYTFERKLGQGGMATVYLAEDLKHHRKVAVKVLREDLAASLGAPRFLREIEIAAQLQHPHILPLFDSGDAAGTLFFVMPYVDGESLEARLARGLPSFAECTAMLRDIARGLGFAHAHHVMHRDIKPANVMLSSGAAMITDFGIAKAIAASRTTYGGATLTEPGSAPGTPAYMAPEQAVGANDADQRVDLYALGCLAYEMLTGQVPFHYPTAQGMVEAHLTEQAAPVKSIRPDCPPLLNDLVMQLLEKDPTRRVQTADDVVQALDDMHPVAHAGPAMTPLLAFATYAVSSLAIVMASRLATIAIGLPDWVEPATIVLVLAGLPVMLVTAYALRPAAGKRTRYREEVRGRPFRRFARGMSWRRTALSGIVAIVMLALFIIGFMVTRAIGIGPAASLFATGTLAPDDRVVIADIEPSVPADSSLARATGDALTLALDQSTVRMVPAADVADALQSMRRHRDDRVSTALALQVAERVGAKAVLAGHLVRVGAGHVVSLELLNGHDGTRLITASGTIDRADDVSTTADRLTAALRRKMGESLRSVAHAVPLARATTTSNAALHLYSEAIRRYDVNSDFPGADSLLRQALALDSTFALAARKLAMTLGWEGAPQASRDSALVASARFADRLPETEKQVALGTYYEYHSRFRDWEKALSAYRAAFVADTMNFVAANHLMTMYGRRQSLDSALYYAKVAFRLSPTPSLGAMVASSLANVGKVIEARRLLDSIERHTSQPWHDVLVRRGELQLDYALNLDDSAHAVALALVAAASPGEREEGRDALANAARLHGQLRRADSLDGLNYGLTVGTTPAPSRQRPTTSCCGATRGAACDGSTD
ncbi:MAG: protein kinase domain-containing protein [Gemmatimonadales bacterium]